MSSLASYMQDLVFIVRRYKEKAFYRHVSQDSCQDRHHHRHHNCCQLVIFIVIIIVVVIVNTHVSTSKTSC